MPSILNNNLDTSYSVLGYSDNSSSGASVSTLLELIQTLVADPLNASMTSISDQITQSKSKDISSSSSSTSSSVTISSSTTSTTLNYGYSIFGSGSTETDIDVTTLLQTTITDPLTTRMEELKTSVDEYTTAINRRPVYITVALDAEATTTAEVGDEFLEYIRLYGEPPEWEFDPVLLEQIRSSLSTEGE